MKVNGDLNIVTDSKSYLREILKIIYNFRSSFYWQNQTKSSWSCELDEFKITKYYKKAIKYDRKPIYIRLKKL